MSLHFAAESGRLDDVKHFLTDDNVDTADEKGVSILHIASHSSHARAYDYPWSQPPPQLWSMCCVAKIRKDPYRSIPGNKAALKFDELTKFTTTFHVLVCV